MRTHGLVTLLGCLAVAAPVLGAAPPRRPSPRPTPKAEEDVVTRREIDELRRQIVQETRSSVELLFDGHVETGDLNSRLDFMRYGVRVNFKRDPKTTLHAAAVQTPYLTRERAFRSTATGITLGLRRRLTDRREAQAELSGVKFSTGHWGVTGLAGVTFRPSDSVRWSVSLQRTNVEESRLSVAGLDPVEGPFAGSRVGGVYDNRLTAGVSYRLPRRFDAYAEGSYGSREGRQVSRNFFRRAGGGLGYVALARAEDHPLSFVRVSLSVDYFGFDQDRLGYGGASFLDSAYEPLAPEALGADGISPDPEEGHPGVGGYFSPRRFLSRGLRVEARGRPRPSLEYDVAAFVGRQTFTGVADRGAAGVSARLTLHLRDGVSVPVAYAWDDFGPFKQQSLATRLVVLF